MENSKTPMLFPIPEDKVWEKMREIMHDEITKLVSRDNTSYETPGLTYKPLYKAEELIKLLHVTRQTLHKWNKDGILRPFKIKSRVYYLWTDIEKLITAKQE